MTSEFPAGYGRITLAEVGSTNAEALRRAGTDPAPFWLMAERQTAGRGRRGRPWQGGDGNFFATLLLRPSDAPQTLALRSFAASLALYDALVALGVAADTLSLKWPNDVLLNDGKLAGILLETGDGGKALAIGIGVNLVETPARETVEPNAAQPVSLLKETGIACAAADFLAVLAHAFDRWEVLYRAQGFAPLRHAWLERAARLGQEITARTMRDEITGRFEDVDAEGRLILSRGGMNHILSAADVYF